MPRYIPTIFEPTPGGMRQLDPYSKLLNEERTILLDSPIDDDVASAVIAQLLYLKSVSSADITIYINSPGGSVSAGLAMYDVINHIPCDVVTVCMGMAASMGAFLLSSGTKGKRFALPNSTIMIHQPRIMGQGIEGTTTDIAIFTRHFEAAKLRLAKILASNCDQPLDKLIADTERDNYLSSEEAVEYGLIDRVLFPEEKGAKVKKQGK